MISESELALQRAEDDGMGTGIKTNPHYESPVERLYKGSMEEGRNFVPLVRYTIPMPGPEFFKRRR